MISPEQLRTLSTLIDLASPAIPAKGEAISVLSTLIDLLGDER